MVKYLWLALVPIGAILGGAAIADLVALRRGRTELRRRGRSFDRFPGWSAFAPIAARLRVMPQPSPVRRAARGARWIALCLVVLAGFFVVQIVRDFARIDRYRLQLDARSSGEPTNILLVGSDTREDASADDSAGAEAASSPDDPAGRRADTIMVLRIDEQRGNAKLLSVPRDLWVVSAGDGGRRINETYGESRQQLVDAVRDTLGVRLHRYIEIDFTAFRRLVDAVNGVPLQPSAPLRDDWTGLLLADTSCRRLDGLQSLELVRSRHLEFFDGTEWVLDATADRGRIDRQQAFLVALAHALRSSNFADPRQIRRFTEVAGDHLGVDRGFSLQEMLRVARRMKGIDPADLQTLVVPTRGFVTAEGLAVLESTDELPIVVREFLDGGAASAVVVGTAVTDPVIAPVARFDQPKVDTPHTASVVATVQPCEE